MKYIFTTQTALLAIKKDAKKHVNQSNKLIKLNAALNQAAIKAGYDDYRHANECLKKTPKSLLNDTPTLPNDYQTWANELCDINLVPEATQALLASGFLFAFDFKEAESAEDNPAFVECNEALHMIFDDIARDWLYSKDEEDNIRMIDKYSAQYNQESIIDTVNGLRFFIPSNDYKPRDFDELKLFLNEHVFFYPEIIWFKQRLVWLRFAQLKVDILG